MVAPIGKIASPAQGVGYFEKDGYYPRDDGAHREASAWAGRGAEALGLSGPVDPERFRAVLEGKVSGGRRLGRKEIDGSITHRPGRDVTLSAPKSVSLMAMVGGDERIVEAHDRTVVATLGWIERNAVETRMRDPATGAMVRAGDQKMVAALPAGNPKLTDQRAFYVAISRARDIALLVTDDAHKLADQLERATGERLAALDATANGAGTT